MMPFHIPEGVSENDITVACAFGGHDGCFGIIALGSTVVPERPCKCPCHHDAEPPADHNMALAYLAQLEAAFEAMTLPPDIGGEFRSVLSIVRPHIDVLRSQIHLHATLVRRPIADTRHKHEIVEASYEHEHPGGLAHHEHDEDPGSFSTPIGTGMTRTTDNQPGEDMSDPG